MLVHELVAQLLEQNQDAKVHFAYNYGDHWNTEVAPVVCDVSAGVVAFSEYHSMPKVIDEDDIDAEGEEVNQEVVIIR